MLLLLLLAAALAAADTCYNEHGLLVASAFGVDCVECNLQGYLAGGACVCYAANLDAQCQQLPKVAAPVVSSCLANFCEDEDAECVLSQQGVRCRECGAKGYIAPNPNLLVGGSVCVCYDPASDPNALCEVLNPVQQTIVFTKVVAAVWCAFFADPRLGFYRDNFDCLTSFLGPVPNQAITSDECLTYGGADPEQPLAGFYTCWNHGSWNASAFNCTCDAGWAFAPTGEVGVFHEPVYSCTQCAPWYGPTPAQGLDLPFCREVWAPDPLDGIPKPCSGHGVFTGGACACYQNATGGFWGTVALPPTGALTCAGCAAGYSGANCTLALPSSPPNGSFYYTTRDMYAYGDVGTQANANALCALAADPFCQQSLAMLCRTDENLIDFPAIYGFNATGNFSFDGPLFIELYAGEPSVNGSSPTWQGFVNLTHLILGATPGCDDGGIYNGNNCQDFTSTDGYMVIEEIFYFFTNKSCNEPVRLPCVCIIQ